MILSKKLKIKKVCVVIASRANYGRIKYLLKAIEKHPNLKLQLVVGASTLLERFGKAVDIIKKDGFKPLRSIYYVVEGENLTTQAKSTGLGVVELATAFEDLKPDMVITVADRYETMATAIASTYLNIPLIHVQGGEISGNIDNRVRNSITQLADFHFVATKKSAQRVISMGIDKRQVFNLGCPSIDVIAKNDLKISNKIMKNYLGAGKVIDWRKPYILVVQHPVTTSYGNGFYQITETMNALKILAQLQKVVLWPNVDAGSDHVSKGIRHFREFNMNEHIYYYKNFSPEDYGRVLNNAICCVGNSSSFIREGSFLGTPTVLIGDRQKGREIGKNIKISSYDRNEIVKKIKIQIKHGKYKSDKNYGEGKAGEKIANKIASII